MHVVFGERRGGGNLILNKPNQIKGSEDSWTAVTLLWTPGAIAAVAQLPISY